MNRAQVQIKQQDNNKNHFNKIFKAKFIYLQKLIQLIKKKKKMTPNDTHQKNQNNNKKTKLRKRYTKKKHI